MDDSRQVADLTHTKQFLWAVFAIIKFPIEIDARFFFCLVHVYEYNPTLVAVCALDARLCN